MKKAILLSAASMAATTFTMAQQVVPNGDFEKWDSLSIVDNVRIYNPEGWSSYNAEMIEGSETFQPVQITSDAYNGNYAVKISSKAGTGKGMPGVLFTGREIDPEKESGFPINGKIDKIEGYYKYAPDGNDSATVAVLFFKDGSQIGGAMHVIKQAADTYAKFSLQLQYPENAPDPDAAKVYVFAGAPENEASNSVLYLDNLNFMYKSSTGIAQLASVKPLTICPNPASTEITFTGQAFNTGFQYRIIDMQGKFHLQGLFITNTLDIYSLATGLYFVQVISPDGAIYQARLIKE